MPSSIDCPTPPNEMTAAVSQEDSRTTNVAGGNGGAGTPSGTSAETPQDSQTIPPPAPTAAASSLTAENAAVDAPREVTAEAILSYYNEVLLNFANQPQHLHSYTEILQEFKTARGTKFSEVFERLACLLKAHAPALIPGFNQFSKNKFIKIRVPEEAVAYLEQVKQTFVDQPIVYNVFVNMMKELKSEKIDVLRFINRVAYLFKEHTQLFEGFNAFLPLGFHIKADDNNLILVYSPVPEPIVPAPSTSSVPSATSSTSRTSLLPPSAISMILRQRPESQTQPPPRQQP